MKRRYKSLIAFLMAGVMALCPVPVRAFAYDVGDYVIEWDEIEDIVTGRNPTYTLIMDSATDSIDLIIDGVSDDIRTLKESISVSSGPMRDILETSLSEMGSTLRTLRYSEARLERSLSPVRDQLAAAIRTLIISEKILEVNAGMLDAQVSLYEELLLQAQRMESEGLATQAETSSYERELSSARSSLSALESASRELMGHILMLTGYEQDDDVVLADLPAPDRDFLSSRDIDADRDKYIASDSAVLSALDVSAYSGDVFRYRDLQLSIAEADAAAEFNTLYTAVETAVTELEAAEISLRMAELQSDAAERKLALGLIGSSEYAALRLQYIASRASYDLALLNLHQAIVNYPS